MEFLLSDMDQITIKLKIHGVVHGENKDILELPELVMVLECADFKWNLLILPPEK